MHRCFWGFFCCHCCSFFIPNAPKLLLSSFPFRLNISFSQLLNIGLYVTNSFIFLSLGDVFISSSFLKDDFPEYEIHGNGSFFPHLKKWAASALTGSRRGTVFQTDVPSRECLSQLLSRCLFCL